MVLDVLTLSLREHGYMVNAVKDGWDVLKSMFHSDHDAILLDLNMPRLDGITTVKALRKMDPHTYVLIISGEASEFKIKQALENGANAFLKKPFTISALLDQLKKIDFARISIDKRVLREEKEKLMRKRHAWHRIVIRRLRSPKFRRNMAFAVLAFAIACFAGLLIAFYSDRQYSIRDREDTYLKKMDQLIDAIRQDWGR